MCVHVCMVCVVFDGGGGVEGVCPRVSSLSSLYKGPLCSPWWHLTQCLSSSPVSGALCPANRPVPTHTHTHTHTHLHTHTLNQPCPYRVMTHTHKPCTPPIPWESWSLGNLDHWHNYGSWLLTEYPGLLIVFASDVSPTHSDSFAVKIRSRSPQLALMGPSFTSVEEEEEGGEGEITFTTGHSD